MREDIGVWILAARAGLDAIDKTPILDIKPYFPQFDCREDAVTPNWVNEFMKEYF
jgi:tRNA (Thr-GGU) A37 N-methylase